MHKVIKDFVDLQDNRQRYSVGDIFPRNGLTVDDERLKSLSGSDNLSGKPLIVWIPEETENKPEKEPEEKPVRKRGRKNAEASL